MSPVDVLEPSKIAKTSCRIKTLVKLAFIVFHEKTCRDLLSGLLDHLRWYAYKLTSIKRLGNCVEDLLDFGVARHCPARLFWEALLYFPPVDLSAQGASKAKVLVTLLRLETKPYPLVTTRQQSSSTAMPFARTTHHHCCF